MSNELSTFQVYNASAGSGKTFTLVKEYLKIILQADDVFRFQKILAITFTNKAAAEMRTRLLDNLLAFSKGEETGMYQLILEETSLDKSIIVKRSQKILEAVLNNYTAFSITTIDSFTYKIIRSFAHDLGLTLNFEVEMDSKSLLGEAVDLLISKIGVDQGLTKVLIDFSLEKTDDDRSWDISRELNDFAQILLNENDAKYFKKLSTKKLQDFYDLKDKLEKSSLVIENVFKSIGQNALQIIKENGLEFSDFAYSAECPKHFEKLLNFKYLKSDDLKFEGRIDKSFAEDKNLFAAKASQSAKDTINELYDVFKALYLESKQQYLKLNKGYVFNKLALKSIIPLAVLNDINSELQQLKQEHNIQLHAEFNKLISDTILEQPAPFIYERIGQRFMHYFIDEMQDTSKVQWGNLIPLIDNALAQEGSSLLLVGDPKQAIYRWRGGEAEQFIALGGGQNPFQTAKDILNLNRNFRSYSEIVEFSNQFFQHSTKFITNDLYKDIFIQGNQQLKNSKQGGSVTLTFLEEEQDVEERRLRYAKKTFEKIQYLVTIGYDYGEICVLTRKKSDGVDIANYLSENDIPLISPDTLLLSNSLKVNFILSVLAYVSNPLDQNSLFEFLSYLHSHWAVDLVFHDFVSVFISLKIEDVFSMLKKYGSFFNFSKFRYLSLYEKVEEIISGFSLLKVSDAYVQFFLDVVLEQQQKGSDLRKFLVFWHEHKDKLSVMSSSVKGAVQVMTIHKSKGLEFPVVIFPCDLDIYKQINPKIWLDRLPLEASMFDALLLSYTKEFQTLGDYESKMYQDVREKLELDNFNLLYVALTRPVEHLFVITDVKGKANHYASFFVDYLKSNHLFEPGKLEYVFGDLIRLSSPEISDNLTETQGVFINSLAKSGSIQILPSSSQKWDEHDALAIEYGSVIHKILSKVVFNDNLEEVVDYFIGQGLISSDQQKTILTIISKIVFHSKLVDFFTRGSIRVFNERAIIDLNSEVKIPDRLVFHADQVSILEYKTGDPHLDHHYQIKNYATILETAGYRIKDLYIVYISEKIKVVEVKYSYELF